MRRDSFLRGAFILAAGTLVSRMLGAIWYFVLPLLWGGGEPAVYGLGLFGQGLNIYIVVLTLSSLGIPLAVSRLVAERVARGDVAGAEGVFAVARRTLATLGLTLTVAMLAAAPVFGRVYGADVVPSLVAVAPAVFLVSVMSAYRGWFQGLRIMTPYAVSQVVEQTARVGTMLVLGVLLLPLGMPYAAAGASFGAVTGAVVGLAYLVAMARRVRTMLSRREGGTGGAAGDPRGVLGELIRLAIPYSLAGLAYPLLGLVDALVVPLRLAHAGLGQREAIREFSSLTQIANRLANVPTAFTTGIALSLMPAVAEVHALRQWARVNRLASAAVRVTLLLTVPMAVGLVALASELPELLFRWPPAAVAIRVLAPATVFLGIQQMSSAVLQGIGLAELPVRNLFAGVAVKALATWVLTYHYGIPGAALATVLGFATSGGLNLATLYARGLRLEGLAGAIARPCLAAAAMFVVVRAAMGWLLPELGLALATLAGVALGAVTYAGVLLALGGVRAEDFDMIPRYGPRIAQFLQRLGLLRG